MNDLQPVNVVRSLTALIALLVAIGVAGCNAARRQTPHTNDESHPSLTPQLHPVDLSNPIRPMPTDQPVGLRAARNEWTSFTLQLSGVFADRPGSLRIRVSTPQIANVSESITVYQVLPMPVQVNPGYVRHAGQSTDNGSIPRALLPVATNGVVSIASLRDPTQPLNPAAHPNGVNVLLWVDLHVPLTAPSGEQEISCEMLDARGRTTGRAVSVRLTVYDFSIPNERHLQVAGRIEWGRLAALYPDRFGDTITPNLINRRDPRYATTVAALDQLVSLGQMNRTDVIVPGLRPTVKWPGGEPPQIDWREFDALVAPWMRGEAFADHIGLGFWPLPAAENLDRYDPRSRLDYWTLAADHFRQREWLDRAPVPTQLAADADPILAATRQARVMLPLTDDQLAPIAPQRVNRVLSAGQGLVSSAPQATLIRNTDKHSHWLSTDMSGPVPYAGSGGDERDVRIWAWLAFLRHADLVLWNDSLPAVNAPLEPADPSSLVWFYPGQWFGIDQPLPTIQLKWLRRAQQDYEYLWLASQRGEVINALQMARLITKPVEIQPGQPADPVYSLMSGTTDPRAWDEAQDLLARSILLRQPGQPVDDARQRALYIQTLQWAEPRERPLLVARSADWTLAPSSTDSNSPSGPNRLHLRLGLDIYNASDIRPDRNTLRWSQLPPGSGWQVQPRPIDVPQLQTYRVQPATMTAQFDLDRAAPSATSPLELCFVNGFTKVETRLKVVLAVAACDRREGPLALDGRLNDWNDGQSICDGPMVLMLSRPDLQNQQIQFAPVPSKIYSAWGPDNFYLAFALEGLSPDPHQAHNEVYYEARRAWSEDLCEALIQPVYADNAVGPVLHVVCKPTGADWVEQKGRPSKTARSTWEPVGGSSVRYATTNTASGHWRGEVAIPWKLICGPDHDLPVLLRFNFAQHRAANCQSASWAGPVDFGRDENLTGVLYLRTPRDIGINSTARQDSPASRGE